MPQQAKLSARQEAMLAFIGRFIEENGYPPTIREIGDACSISSTSVVNYNLNKLEQEGLLTRDRKVSRGLQLSEDVNPADAYLVRVPLAGPIAAGVPMTIPGSDFSTFSDDDAIELSRTFVGQDDTLFALRVQGDSMIDAMIKDGDIVIMRPQHEARNGEMVAVWLEEREETTLKHFYQENGRIRLQPANPTMPPIYVDNPAAVKVQGKVVAVLRREL